MMGNYRYYRCDRLKSNDKQQEPRTNDYYYHHVMIVYEGRKQLMSEIFSTQLPLVSIAFRKSKADFPKEKA